MKQFAIEKSIFSNPGRQGSLYLAENGLLFWDVTLDLGIGKEILIGHLSDIHYNYCNHRDFDEEDPVLMSTLEHRRWLAGGASVPKARRCLECLDEADQIILNGDTLDYLSQGAMELMQREIWDKYPGIIATVGGHEFARKMQGTVPETMIREERVAMVRQFWKHDIDYVSKLIGSKVLVVGLCNDLARFNEDQYRKLAVEISLAREKGWVVLLFAHEPIVTGDPAHKLVTVKDAIQVGDPSGFPDNYCDGGYAGGHSSDEATMAMYRLITGSADVIKGFFAGHLHSDLYLEIAAKLPDGTPTVIPQYIRNTTVFQNGHLMRILIR